MEFQSQSLRSARPHRRALLWAVLVGGAVLAACEEPVQPRNFADFTEDRIAREGTLARCNANREATLNDIECANARRAAAAIALRQERDRREALERESEIKLADLRDRLATQERLAREAAEAQARAEERAYDALWNGPGHALEPVTLPAGLQSRALESPGPRLEEVAVPDRSGAGTTPN